MLQLFDGRIAAGQAKRIPIDLIFLQQWRFSLCCNPIKTKKGVASACS
jgi:hypothetical protein